MLNIGFDLGIVDHPTFSMFIVQTLLLTAASTPLTLCFYPPKYRGKRVGAKDNAESSTNSLPSPNSDHQTKTRFALILDNFDQLPTAMTISLLLQPDKSVLTTSTSGEKQKEKKSRPPSMVSGSAGLERNKSVSTASTIGSSTIYERPESASNAPRDPPISDQQVAIHLLRLIKSTARTSSVIKSQQINHDPIVSAFRTFGCHNGLLVSASLSIVNYGMFTAEISKHVVESDSQMVILPWSRRTTAEADRENKAALNALDRIFRKTGTQKSGGSMSYAEFVRKVFVTSPKPVALFVDHGVSTNSALFTNHHLLLIFFGGADDRLALSFVVQLCSNEFVSATAVKIRKMEAPTDTALESENTTVDAQQVG